MERANFKLGVKDQLFVSPLSALEKEVRRPSEQGSVFIDAAITMLMHKALYSDIPKYSQPSIGGLSPYHLTRVNDFIQSSLGYPIKLEDLSNLVGLSQHHFCRAFKTASGKSPHQYLTEKRIERSMEMLSNSDRSITDIAFINGFSSQSHFCTTFRKLTGITPANYRRASQI